MNSCNYSLSLKYSNMTAYDVTSRLDATSVSYIWGEIVKVSVAKDLQFKTVVFFSTLLRDSWSGKWDLRIIWSFGLKGFLFYTMGKKTQTGKITTQKLETWNLSLRGHYSLMSGSQTVKDQVLALAIWPWTNCSPVCFKCPHM